MIQAFFSYAHIDWEAPADREDVQGLVNGLQPQVHAELGRKGFRVWRDDKLRMGNRWRSCLDDVLQDSEFLIVLLSQGWLKSEICGWEYDSFKRKTSVLGQNDRILPISLRKLDEDDLKGLTEQQRRRYDELLAIQQANWRDLPQLSERDLRRLLSTTAKAMKSCVHSLPKPTQGAQTVSTRQPESMEVPVNGHVVPPVSGDYYIPRQARDTAQLKLAVAGLTSVETDEGTVVFAIKGLTVQTVLDGGRIVNENTKFSTGWQGPIAKVTRVQTGVYRTTLQIDAATDYLQGEPLVGRGDVGHVHMFDIDAPEAAHVDVRGTVSIQRQAVEIIEKHCDLEPDEKEARDVMIKRLTTLLLKKHITPNANLEGARDDRSAND